MNVTVRSRMSLKTWAAGALTGIGLSVITAAAPLSAQGPHGGMGMMGEMSPELRELRQELAAMSLVQELALSEDQRDQLLEVLGPFRKASADLKKEREALDAQAVKILSAARDEMKKTGALTEATQAKLDALQDQKRALMDKGRTQAQPVIQAALEVLSPAQAELVKGFHPGEAMGLTPPAPERALERADALRDLEPDQVAAKADHIRQRTLENGGTEAEADARAATFRALAAEAQGYSDEAWAEEREDFARRAREQLGHGKGGAPGKGGHGKGGHGKGGPGMGPGGGHRGEMGTLLLISEAFYDALDAR